jgi:hypothetical protein
LKKTNKTRCLRSADNGGREASTLPTELNVAREVVLDGGGVHGTLNTERGGGLGVGDDELDLAEHAARRHIGATHVTELASTRTVDGGGVASTRDVEGVGGGGATRTSPGGRGELTVGGVQGVDATRVGEGGNGDEVTSVSGDLLEEGGDGGHLILYPLLRK